MVLHNSILKFDFAYIKVILRQYSLLYSFHFRNTQSRLNVPNTENTSNVNFNGHRFKIENLLIFLDRVDASLALFGNQESSHAY